MKHQCMSALAKATLPLSGLSRNSGSGSIPLCAVENVALNGILCKRLPDERVDLLNGMFDLVVGVRGLDAQLKD